jgi:hypothetical protein
MPQSTMAELLYIYNTIRTAVYTASLKLSTAPVGGRG